MLMPTLGGSVPIWAFTDILKLPTLIVPYANANNRQHSPNEHLRLDHLFQGVRTTAQLLTDLAAGIAAVVAGPLGPGARVVVGALRAPAVRVPVVLPCARQRGVPHAGRGGGLAALRH